MSEPGSLPEPDPMEEFAELTGFSDGIPVAEVKSLKAVVGELMWLARLPYDEQETFWWELYTAMDEVHATRPAQQFGVYAAKAVGPLLHAWKATAQAHADGLPEILATAEMGDFGEVQRPECGCGNQECEYCNPIKHLPPYAPKYAVHSIINGGGPDRYRVVSTEEVRGHYVLRPLFSSAVRADLVLWAWQDCDEHSRLEWVDDKPVYGLASRQGLRTLTAEELKELGVTSHDQ